jgi:hypothetical protein
MQLLDDLKETRRYWKLKEEAQDRTFGELSLEEAMDLSQDRQILDLRFIHSFVFFSTVEKVKSHMQNIISHLVIMKWLWINCCPLRHNELFWGEIRQCMES